MIRERRGEENKDNEQTHNEESDNAKEASNDDQGDHDEKSKKRTSSSLSSLDRFLAALSPSSFPEALFCPGCAWTNCTGVWTCWVVVLFAFRAALFELLAGFVWILTCLVSSSDLENLFSQPGNVQAWGFSPVCVRMWRVYKFIV